MDQFVLKYYLWYLEGHNCVLMNGAPTEDGKRFLLLAGFFLICLVCLIVTVSRVWNDRHVALKTLGIILGTVVFGCAVHEGQRLMFLTGLEIAEKMAPASQPLCLDIRAIPITAPFLVIISGQFVLFFLVFGSRPKSGPPPVPTRIANRT
jgi:hypothetical protein